MSGPRMEAARHRLARGALRKHGHALATQHQTCGQQRQRYGEQERGEQQTDHPDHERQRRHRAERLRGGGQREAAGAQRDAAQAQDPERLRPREPLHLAEAIVTGTERLPHGVGVDLALQLERDRLPTGVERQRDAHAELGSGHAFERLADDRLRRKAVAADGDLPRGELELGGLRRQLHPRAEQQRGQRRKRDREAEQLTRSEDHRREQEQQRRRERQPPVPARPSRLVDPRAHRATPAAAGGACRAR